jgi:hypothetical protein
MEGGKPLGNKIRFSKPLSYAKFRRIFQEDGNFVSFFDSLEEVFGKYAKINPCAVLFGQHYISESITDIR